MLIFWKISNKRDDFWINISKKSQKFGDSFEAKQKREAKLLVKINYEDFQVQKIKLFYKEIFFILL